MKKISFCINTTGKEKDYLDLLLTSMENNFVSLEHEVIIFIDSFRLQDDDNEDIKSWLLSRDNKFKNIKILKNKLSVPIGYAPNINLMFESAENEIVSYIQSDMIVGKKYDEEILRHLNDENTIVSATRVEPSLHPPSPEKYTQDFGLNPDEFDLNAFNTFVEQNTDLEKVTHYWFAPFTLYKQRWLEIGGHDTLFRRSREDSDILMRLRLNGCNIIQTWSALVYHFTCVSSRGKGWFMEKNRERTELQKVADEIEMNKYIRKWKSFEHSAEPINSEKYVYESSIVLNGCNDKLIHHILNISQFFDNVYIDDEKTLKKVLKVMREKSNPANELFGYTDEDWIKYSKYFRTYDYTNIFKNKQKLDDKDNVVVYVNVNDINNHERFNFLVQFNDIIHHQTEPHSEFDYDVFKIIVKEKNNIIKNHINVKNPNISLKEIIGETL